MNYTDLTAYRKSNPFMDFCGIEAVRAEHDDCEVKMTITATDKNTMGKEEPTAATASSPTNFPTTAVSTIL